MNNQEQNNQAFQQQQALHQQAVGQPMQHPGQIYPGGNSGYTPPPQNYDEEDGEANDDSADRKDAGKRRSKHDADGRDFKCKFCDKTYLSYPALYTHMKQKHSKGPDGESRAPLSSGRGRGRPRKNPYQRIDPKSEEWFKDPQRANDGVATDPTFGMAEHFTALGLNKKYASEEEYPIFKHLVQFKSEVSEANGEDEENKKEDVKSAEENGHPNASRWARNYDKLSDQDRLEMLVDEIFALYLFRTAQRVNKTYYKVVLAYTIFFRECLNEIGWQKRLESEQIKLEEDPSFAKDMEANKDFCLVNTAEHAPEICNEFVTVYIEQNKGLYEIQKPDQIDLTINLCHWLFENQFTCSKLSLIS